MSTRILTRGHAIASDSTLTHVRYTRVVRRRIVTGGRTAAVLGYRLGYATRVRTLTVRRVAIRGGAMRPLRR